jgi:hypothetical protein
MNTDFTPQPPHSEYECTLHIRGNRAWFQTIRDLLGTSVPEDVDQAHAKDFIRHEIEDVINWIDGHEKYYVKDEN